MVRPPFPQRPPGIVGIIPALPRHPVPGIRGPIIPPVVRPAGIPSVSPAEKPQTTVYVGKISSTVENDFIISLLQVSHYIVICFFCSLLSTLFCTSNWIPWRFEFIKF